MCPISGLPKPISSADFLHPLLAIGPVKVFIPALTARDP
jgi:hypothetical protein